MRTIERACVTTLTFALLVLVGTGSLRAQEATLIAAGDIEWSRVVKAPATYEHNPDREEGDWTVVPYLNLAENRAAIQERVGRELDDPADDHHLIAIKYGLEFSSLEDEMRHPFQRTRDIFRTADIAFANLEMPLSSRARHTGAFLSHPAFADALRWTGFDVVATANNHAFDAGERGLLDTIDALRKAGVGSVGTGHTLEDARRPYVVERNGITVAFLGYARSVNDAGSDAFARPERSGVMPLDPFLIKEDIRRVRDQVDYVVLSFHWAIENSKDTHPDARAFAYEMLDAGADIIFGHHPHVPRGVEVYNGKVIFYSLGNYTFGHNHTYWGDGYLGRLTLTPDRITEVEILPLAGEGNDMAQPYVLEGERAQVLLQDIQERSEALDTRMEIDGNTGVILPGAGRVSDAH